MAIPIIKPRSDAAIPAPPVQPLAQYTSACERSAAQVIHAYSTSFGVATRMLGQRHRQHVRNVYALVRVADELVDGVAAEAGLDLEMQLHALNELESMTNYAMQTNYSSNPVVHVFASTARSCGIETELVTSFFASMRMDLRSHQPDSVVSDPSVRALIHFAASDHAAYVDGSAEAVGLMCLRVFMREETVSDAIMATLENGARNLGAAFQNINFLRDLADDTQRLGRSYLSLDRTLTPAQQQQWIDTIREQLRVAADTLPILPADARMGVTCALRLFSRLTERLAYTPTQNLYTRRVRLHASRKIWIVAQAMLESRRVKSS